MNIFCLNCVSACLVTNGIVCERQNISTSWPSCLWIRRCDVHMGWFYWEITKGRIWNVTRIHFQIFIEYGFPIGLNIARHFKLILQKPKPPNSIPKNANDMLPTNEIFGYNPCSQSWTRISITDGDVPPRTTGACG